LYKFFIAINSFIDPCPIAVSTSLKEGRIVPCDSQLCSPPDVGMKVKLSEFTSLQVKLLQSGTPERRQGGRKKVEGNGNL